MDEEQAFIGCPKCGDDGPHNLIDNNAAECRQCYTSIDLTGGEEE